MKTVKMRINDKHQAVLSLMAREVNTVWNFCNKTALALCARSTNFCRATTC